MQLTGKDIEKQCDRGRLIRGKALYASKAVQNLTIIEKGEDVRDWMLENYEEGLSRLPEETEQENSLCVVQAEVLGSTGNEYHPVLILDSAAEDRILYASCDCKDYMGGTPFCKHCVAVGHNVVMQLLEEKLSDKLVSARDLEKQKEGTTAGKDLMRDAARRLETGYASAYDRQGSHSSSAIMQLIKTYSGVDQSIYWSESEKTISDTVMNEPVQLFPNIVVDYYGTQNVEFKIGTEKKKYVLKDIGQFYELLQGKEYFSYGKSLSFVHDRNNFTEESLYYIHMIEDMHSIGGLESHYDRMHTTRYMRLTDGYMEQMLLGHLGSMVSINGKVCQVVDKNPRIPLKIEKAEMGVYLTLPNLLLIKGLLKDFVLDEKQRVVYVVSEGFQKNAIPFIRTFQQYKDWNYIATLSRTPFLKCYLNHRDYVSFCGHVFRKVERYFDIEEKEVDLHTFMPEECQIKIYLDAPTQDSMTCNLKACYGEETYNLADWAAVQEGSFRDLETERKAYQTAKRYFPSEQREGAEYLLSCHSEGDMYQLLESGMKELEGLGELYVSDAIRQFHIRKTPKVTAGVQVQGELLQLRVDIPEMSSDEIGEILSAYRMKRRYYRMRNGDFMQLDGSGLGTLAEMSSGLGIRDEDWGDGSVELPLYRANYIDAVMKERGKNMLVVRSSQFKSIIRGMREVADSDYEVPKGIQAELRGYQKTGYRWLKTLSHYGFGGILADDMGLGKTLQVITLLLSVLQEPGYNQKENTSFIVCPASLVYNWESEFHKFAPDIRVKVIVGTAAQRQKQLKSLKQTDVVITSYDLLKRDLEWYSDKPFLYMIIDEAQYIKNAATQVAKAVKSIRASHCFALTGTPLENRLSDLWSIFDFVMKGYLYSYETFRKNYEVPIVAEKDEDALKRLQKMVAPFILRRRKKEVLQDLPDKIENIIYTTMTEPQEKYYHARFLKLRRDLVKKSDVQFREDKMKVLAELTRLRQLCCDPNLFIEDYKGGSGKVDAFLSMAEELVAGGSNILVFSQFATMLEILKKELDKLEIHTLLLTGQNSKEERRAMVEEFQEGQSTVFLISLKAGGTGLNLTAADTVIHFDPWWNIAAQNQATDRAHRIGQDKVVTVTQLVMKNSIEERIIDLQNRKKELVDHVIEGESVANATLTKEEIMGLLEEF